ncbi:hypothetical protein [Yinghuangia soli]|uniref:Outer membrane protein assembly factor BamB n=1 Tax=Yinghuangia soli TaxID=2908204 RepID=A0AA41Q1Q9_9ACTN|nr:hypothetical protein [Yinghuangia soli]MCF2529706.1 hypothetical protein [Yinghuangia soli]
MSHIPTTPPGPPQPSNSPQEYGNPHRYRMPPSAPPGRARKRITSVAAVVVLVGGALAACGGKQPAAQPSDVAPSASAEAFDAPAKEPGQAPIPPELTMAWNAPPVTPGGPTGRTLAAIWQTDAKVYIGRGTGVDILDAATGKVTGAVAPPSPGLGVCGMTEGLTKSGLGAVAWTSADKNWECTTVSLVDTAQGGKTLWSTTVAGTRKDGSPLSRDTLTLGFVGDNLLTVMTSNTVVGLRTADNSVAWTWKVPPTTSYISNDEIRTSSDRVLVLMTEDVDERGAEPLRRTAVLDASGTQLTPQAATLKLNPKERVHLLSASPLTAIVRPDVLDDTTPPRIQTFDRNGVPGKDFPLSGSFGNIEVLTGSLLDALPRWPLKVTPTTVYGLTKPSGTGIRQAHVVAFDIATGAPRWNRQVPKSSSPVILSADDNAVHVLDTSTLGGAMTIQGFAASDGRPADRPSTIRIDDNVPKFLARLFDVYQGRVLMADTSSSQANAVLFRG